MGHRPNCRRENRKQAFVLPRMPDCRWNRAPGRGEIPGGLNGETEPLWQTILGCVFLAVLFALVLLVT